MSPIKPRTKAAAARRPAKVTPARWVAWRTIYRTFEEDAYTDRAFAGEAERAGIAGRERAFAQRLSYGTVQRARTVDHVIAAAGKRPLRKVDPPVLAALRMGMYELLLLDGGDAHAAVSQAVEVVRAAVGERAVAFTNAVLRRGQADGPGLLAALEGATDDDAIATRLSVPEWVVRRMRAGIDEHDALLALQAQLETTPGGTALRHNPLRGSYDELEAALAAAGIATMPPPEPFADALPEALMVEGSTADASPLIDRGLLHPQSLASMLVARALDPQPGERVLDMCAAPGGKTMHAAALMRGEGSLLACDLHEHRTSSIAYLAGRSGAAMVEARAADATTLDTADVGSFDRVLVDAPCSGLGVLHRRPDARWKRREADLPGLVALQQQLLATAARLVRPGGVVVYSTCTLLPEENEDVVDAAIATGALVPDALPPAIPEVLLVEDAPHMARTWPHLHHTDGFFLARLRRPDAGAGDGASSSPDRVVAPT